jgi:hypothetical protein
MNNNERIIRNLIKKESLRILKESQASFLSGDPSAKVKHSMEDVNDVIGVFEKRLEKLNNEEKSATNNEDYLELRNIKEQQLEALSKMINSYKSKIKLLEVQKQELEVEFEGLKSKGGNVFKNQSIDEFSNENFQKDWGLRIKTQNSVIDVVKITENSNAYKVISTDVVGLNEGDLLQLPNLKIGGSGKVAVYRKIEEKFENVKNFTLENVVSLTKNPM